MKNKIVIWTSVFLFCLAPALALFDDPFYYISQNVTEVNITNVTILNQFDQSLNTSDNVSFANLTIGTGDVGGQDVKLRFRSKSALGGAEKNYDIDYRSMALTLDFQHNIHLNDNKKIRFGDDDDAYIEWVDAVNRLDITGNIIQLDPTSYVTNSKPYYCEDDGLIVDSPRSFWPFKYVSGVGLDSTGLYFNTVTGAIELQYLGNAIYSFNLASEDATFAGGLTVGGSSGGKMDWNSADGLVSFDNGLDLTTEGRINLRGGSYIDGIVGALTINGGNSITIQTDFGNLFLNPSGDVFVGSSDLILDTTQSIIFNGVGSGSPEVLSENTNDDLAIKSYNSADSQINFYAGSETASSMQLNNTLLNVNGSVKADGFIGDGSQLTNLPSSTPLGNNTLYVCSQGCEYEDSADLSYHSTPSDVNEFQVRFGCGSYSGIDEGSYVNVKGESSCTWVNSAYGLKVGNSSEYSSMTLNSTLIGLSFPESMEDVFAHDITFYGDEAMTDFITFQSGEEFNNIILKDMIIHGRGSRTDGIGVLSDCSNCLFENFKVWLGKSDDNTPTCVFAGSGITSDDVIVWKNMYCNINDSQNLSITDVAGFIVQGGTHLIDGAVFDITTTASLNDHLAGVWCSGGEVTITNSYFNIRSDHVNATGIEVDSGCTVNIGSGNTFAQGVNNTVINNGGTVNTLETYP